jgi:hypothetical protein
VPTTPSQPDRHFKVTVQEVNDVGAVISPPTRWTVDSDDPLSALEKLVRESVAKAVPEIVAESDHAPSDSALVRLDLGQLQQVAKGTGRGGDGNVATGCIRMDATAVVCSPNRQTQACRRRERGRSGPAPRTSRAGLGSGYERAVAAAREPARAGGSAERRWCSSGAGTVRTAAGRPFGRSIALNSRMSSASQRGP